MNIVEYLSSALRISSLTIEKFISTAPHRYKVYFIPKRNNHGRRKICQPSKELKSIQRVILREFLSELPVHESATAYQPGSSIFKNANSHRENQYALKMDFRNFFPSLIPVDLTQHVIKHLDPQLSEQDQNCLARLFFYSNRSKGQLELSIGAPTSPFISNTLMWEFDNQIFDMCTGCDVTYTRYADDLTFSTNVRNMLFEFPTRIADSLDQLLYPALTINEEKTVFLSKKGNRHVTGLVITNEGEISIGRKKKRIIRSLVHKYQLGELDAKKIAYLKGYLSFVSDVEPRFIEALIDKYDAETVNSIREG